MFIRNTNPPTHVRASICLLAISRVPSLVSAPIQGSLVIDILSITAAVGLNLFIIINIWNRRNWARIFSLLMLISALGFIKEGLGTNQSVYFFLPNFLYIFSVLLLFTKSSRFWFDEVSSEKRNSNNREILSDGINNIYEEKLAQEKDQVDKVSTINLTLAQCPYCGQQLKKIPKTKAKCPHCNKNIWVMIRPEDGAEVIITEDEKLKIYQEHKRLNWLNQLSKDQDLESTFQKTRKKLQNQYEGNVPSDRDVYWRIYNTELLEHARNNDWGLYRNTRMYMARLLMSEGRAEEALRTFLEVAYLDLNAPSNCGGLYESREFPPFNPSDKILASLAPRIIDWIEDMIDELQFSKKQVRDTFIEHNIKVQKSINTPLLPIDAWKDLETKLSIFSN